ncbi:DUF4445 domain-containing protein [Heliobacterium undosum]|uniref:DUF4445 domain-containing protein n=1 Tax=Heliomicrobium undosum TaxID=121734 RepID=A0A845L5I8_9FIRM|nr:DUF4445 domain-containing protein [Heliomicrobium undosum]
MHILFLPSRDSIQVEAGTTILQAARRAGVLIEAPCNGAGTCGKCKVRLAERFRPFAQPGGTHHLTPEAEAEGWVLACEALVTGDIEVEIPQRISTQSLKIISHGQARPVAIDPFFAKAYDDAAGETRVLAGGALVATEPGDRTDRLFGLVVDIGTTTLVASLVHMVSGVELAAASSLNPQSLHGQDVLSRIKFTSDPAGRALMHRELIGEINRLITQVTEAAAVERGDIAEVVFSGNTCMLHLATDTDPTSLGKHPYRPVITGGNHVRAEALGLDVAAYALVYLPPILSAYVGADITAGMLAAGLAELPGVTLFVDIGTNGEMVLAVDGAMAAASTAAGPAFEGMNITHGMRAGRGAIERFRLESDGAVTVKTIEEAEPTGICGSGLLDIAGELAAHGVIDKRGRFVRPDGSKIPEALRERLNTCDGKPVFQIAGDIVLTQKDVRQIQLAKGAIRAGVELLLRSKGVRPEDVDRVFIAGSFGYHLQARSLIQIGLLPDAFEGKIQFLGNTSKTGGQALLLNGDLRRELEASVSSVEVIELADYGDFDQVFVGCLGF